MHRHAIFVLLVGAAGCASMVPKVTDPHAVAPRFERWDAVVAVSRADVYNAALRVLSDSAYQIARSDALSGIIETRPRKESEGQRGAAQARTMLLGGDFPVTLHFLLSPERGDSTRISISGDYTVTDGGVNLKLLANTGDWRFVQGIGEAILARVQR